MLETVTWRTWAILGLGVLGYLAAGMWLQHDDFAEAWMYRLGLTAAAIMPLVFTGIYTWFGLSKTRPAAKWWRNRLGTAIVIAALSLVPIAGPLAWVFWVDDGNLTPGWLAWIEVSGPLVSSAAWLWVSWLWLRVRPGDSADT